MGPLKTSPRSQYRESEHRRVIESPTLAARFAELTAMNVRFSYRHPDGSSRNHEIKFSVNLERASSAFRIDCINHYCVGGDFDLTDVIQDAVAVRQRTVSGEMCCEGWSEREKTCRLPCHQRMAFDVSLEYGL